jgi:hypothetical protein
MAASAILKIQGKKQAIGIDEIDHGAEADPVDQVAEGPADDEGERQPQPAGLRPAAARRGSRWRWRA